MLRINNISKSFEKILAVDNVSLEINNGEFFALLGPSGCGKTTLLRIISGFEKPDNGQIYISDNDITFNEPFHRPTNLLFQNYALFPHLNVYKNISYGLEQEKIHTNKIKLRVEEIIERTDLNGLENRTPDQLSGGQKQRVALARCLVKKPKVLLLDEPLSALDLKLRQAMRVELKTLQKETGITFVFVTHDQEEALTMSDRIAVINQGSIQQIGNPEEIYEKPSNQFVANFIGEANLILGKCEKTGINGICKLQTGHKISINIPDKFNKGDNLTIFIRPERIKINKSKGSSLSQIQEFTYLGNAAHIELLSNGVSVNATLPIDKVKNFKKGDKIEIEFPKSFAQIINT